GPQEGGEGWAGGACEGAGGEREAEAHQPLDEIGRASRRRPRGPGWGAAAAVYAGRPEGEVRQGMIFSRRMGGETMHLLHPRRNAQTSARSQVRRTARGPQLQHGYYLIGK